MSAVQSTGHSTPCLYTHHCCSTESEAQSKSRWIFFQDTAGNPSLFPSRSQPQSNWLPRYLRFAKVLLHY